jgi:DNA-binding MarR family transcriptional regulator
MNYISLINQFWSLNREFCFNPSEIAVYFHLIHVSNTLGWKNPFGEKNDSICAAINVSEPTVTKARKRLVEANLISFVSGKVKREVTVYELLSGKEQGKKIDKDLDKSLGKKILDQSSDLTITQSLPQPFTEAFDINKHKLKHKLNKEEEELSPVGDRPLPPGIKNSKLFPEMMRVYDEFIKKQTGGPGSKINAAEGQAMKHIIEYWRKPGNSGDTSDEGILKSWSYLLNHWDRLELFHQGKLKLVEINSNMVNLVKQIKNPKGARVPQLVESSEKSQRMAGNFFEKKA